MYNLYKDILSSDWLNHIHCFNYLLHQVTKQPIALLLARMQKLFTFSLSVHIYIRVFSISIQSLDLCSKNRANKKECKTLRGESAAGCVRLDAACMFCLS